MIAVFMGSVSPFAGKNVVCLGLAHHMRNQGMKVGYFKPIGPQSMRQHGVLTDEDAILFKDALGLDTPADVICPLVLTAENFERGLRGELGDVRDRIMQAYEQVNKGKDIVFIGGLGRMSAGKFLGYSAHHFVKETGAKVIITEKYRYPYEAIDGFLHVKALLGDQVAGIVFNRIDQSKHAQIDGAVRPFLARHGIDVLGVVAEDPVLAAVPLSEIIDSLHGRLLCGESARDVLIETFLVGAMNVNAALTHFRRTPNKAVITGGDRPDIQLAAIESGSRCLILTGDLYPNERILAKAEEAGVPVVLVPSHTGATIETCEHLAGHLSLRSQHKLDRVSEIIEQSLDFDLLNKKLGLA